MRFYSSFASLVLLPFSGASSLLPGLLRHLIPISILPPSWGMGALFAATLKRIRRLSVDQDYEGSPYRETDQSQEDDVGRTLTTVMVVWTAVLTHQGQNV